MTIQRTLEGRLAAWYRQGDDAGSPPDALRVAILALPDVRRPNPLAWLAPPWARSRAVAAIVLLAAALVGLAVVGATGLVRPAPDTVRPLPIAMDACDVLVAAFGPNEVPNGTSGDHGLTAWGGHVCVNDSWDGGYNDRHLLLRLSSTSTDEARALIADSSNWASSTTTPSLDVVWTELAHEVWLGTSPYAGGGTAAAIAVSHDPYFFIVTEEEAWRALGTAHEVAAVLGFEFEIDIQWPPSADPPVGP